MGAVGRTRTRGACRVSAAQLIEAVNLVSRSMPTGSIVFSLENEGSLSVARSKAGKRAWVNLPCANHQVNGQVKAISVAIGGLRQALDDWDTEEHPDAYFAFASSYCRITPTEGAQKPSLMPTGVMDPGLPLPVWNGQKCLTLPRCEFQTLLRRTLFVSPPQFNGGARISCAELTIRPHKAELSLGDIRGQAMGRFQTEEALCAANASYRLLLSPEYLQLLRYAKLPELAVLEPNGAFIAGVTKTGLTVVGRIEQESSSERCTDFRPDLSFLTVDADELTRVLLAIEHSQMTRFSIKKGRAMFTRGAYGAWLELPVVGECQGPDVTVSFEPRFLVDILWHVRPTCLRLCVGKRLVVQVDSGLNVVYALPLPE